MHSTAWTRRSLAQSSTAQLGPCTVEHKPSLGHEQLKHSTAWTMHSHAQSGHSHAQSNTVKNSHVQPSMGHAQSSTVQPGPCSVMYSPSLDQERLWKAVEGPKDNSVHPRIEVVKTYKLNSSPLLRTRDPPLPFGPLTPRATQETSSPHIPPFSYPLPSYP